jgi:Uma2 family endonuclease
MVELLEPIQIHTRPALEMSDDQFFEFCRINQDLRLERTSEGDILIMTPEAGSTGRGDSLLNYYFEAWAQEDGSGQVFNSSAGFVLPNGAIRSPDIAWVRNSRLKKLTNEQWNTFLPLCPDFALELRSPKDRLTTLQQKMEEYIANGARLGWLLDPPSETVHVYHSRAKAKILKHPEELSGDPVLRNFRLHVPKIWAAIKRMS